MTFPSHDPKSHNSADIQHELKLEELTAQMGEFTNKDVKQMTVIEFYALINQRLKAAKRQD